MAKGMGPLELLGLVTRGVENGTHEGQPVRIVKLGRTYETDRADLWDALTNRERIPRWFLPIEGELKEGGRYQFKGNAGGSITACDKPRRLAVTWEAGGGISWVEVTLKEAGAGRTALELRHLAPVEEVFWKKYGPGATGVGWEGGLLGLGLHVEGGQGPSPETAEAWALSEEGRAFNTRSSELWGEANIAYGTPPDEARAAAAETTAFYTGIPVA